MEFIYFHTTKSGHLEHITALSIKNKSGKRKLSRGGGLRSKAPPDPCVSLAQHSITQVGFNRIRVNFLPSKLGI